MKHLLFAAALFAAGPALAAGVGPLDARNNLSDVANPATALGNLGGVNAAAVAAQIAAAGVGTGAQLGVPNTWTAPQRASTETPAISGATFTPAFSTAQHHRIVLTSACPCTLANPAGLVAGQSGMFEIAQDGTGSRTIGTWGSNYRYAGGTATITLSTAASAVDYIPYYVSSPGTAIVLGGIIKAPVH